jgi:hypothetical protein
LRRTLTINREEHRHSSQHARTHARTSSKILFPLAQRATLNSSTFYTGHGL